MTLPLVFVFTLSGAAALLFENLWFHQAGLALGNSIWASSLVLASFMGGLALGNGLVARAGARIRRPLLFYAQLELAIGVTGLLLVYALPSLGGAIGPLLGPLVDNPLLLNTLRVAIAFMLLLVPATAMGATLPLLVGALRREGGGFGEVLGKLYGWNTFGAVVGSLAGALLLVEWLGIRGSGLFALGMNVTAATIAWRLSSRFDDAAVEPANRVRLSPKALCLIGAAFFSGAILLALEVVWFRFCLLFVSGTDTTFAVMLAVVLGGIALGGLIGGVWLGRRNSDVTAAPVLALCAGALCILLYQAVDTLLGEANRSTPAALGMVLMFPVALISGVLFTQLGEALHGETREEIRTAGLLTLANTTGAMLGPLIAGFVLLPRIGIEGAFLALGGSYAFVAGLALWGGLRPAVLLTRVALVASAGLLVVVIVATPRGMMADRYLARVLEKNNHDGSHRIVAVREGLTETIMYLQQEAWGRTLAHRMLTNGFSMSATTQLAKRYMRLYAQWPVAVHPKLRDALLISYGVGVTAKALTDTPSLERIDVVDISRDVLALSNIVYPRPEDHPLNDPRVSVHIEDGRYFLQTTRRRFDLITGEPPPPKLAGVVNLYTREYFSLIRDRLSDGGMTTYWLPVHSLLPEDTLAIIRAFCDAFDDCTLWHGATLNWMLVGTRGAEGPVSLEHFKAQWSDPVMGPQLKSVGLEVPGQLGATFMFGATDLDLLTAGVEPLTDDFPKRLSDVDPGRYDLKSAYMALMDTTKASERFLRSPLVARLWPPEMIVESLSFFDEQAAIQVVSLEQPVSVIERLHAIDASIGDSTFETLPLLQLGGGPIESRLAAEEWAEGNRDIEVAFHMGIGELARHDFAAAAEYLERLRGLDHRQPWATLYEVYARCLAGDYEPALAILRRQQYDTMTWDFLRRTCDSHRPPGGRGAGVSVGD